MNIVINPLLIAPGATASMAVSSPGWAAPAIRAALGGYSSNSLAKSKQFEQWLGRPCPHHIFWPTSEPDVTFGRWTDQPYLITDYQGWLGPRISEDLMLSIGWPGGREEDAAGNPQWITSIDTMAAGGYDTHIQALGAQLKRRGLDRNRVRLMWEFNSTPGGGAPWECPNRAGTPETVVVAAFRRLVMVLRQSCPNIRPIWCPAIFSNWLSAKNRPVNVAACYPGDDVVWGIYCDCYLRSWPGGTDAQKWANILGPSTDGDFRLGDWNSLVAKHPGKAWGLGEWGTFVDVGETPGQRDCGDTRGLLDRIIFALSVWSANRPLDRLMYWNEVQGQVTPPVGYPLVYEPALRTYFQAKQLTVAGGGQEITVVAA